MQQTLHKFTIKTYRMLGLFMLAVIILSIFEDLFRKYVDISYSFHVLILKDLLVIFLLLFFFIYIRKRFLILKNIWMFLGVMFLYDLVAILFNLETFNLIVFINGIKGQYLYYLLIPVFLYFLEGNLFYGKIRKLAVWVIVFIFLTQLLQLLFYDSVQNLDFYTTPSENHSVAHSFGTELIHYYNSFYFSPTKLSEVVFSLFCLYIFVTFLTRRNFSIEFVVITLITLASIVLSGKRIFIISILFFILSIFFYSWRSKISYIRRGGLNVLEYRFFKSFFKYTARLKMLLYFILPISLFSGAEKIELMLEFFYISISSGVYDRFFDDNQLYGLAFSRFLEIDHFWYGQGAGSNTPNIDFLCNCIGFESFEMGFFKYINEHGFIGFILFMLLVLYILGLLFRSFYLHKNGRYKIISGLLVSYFIIIFIRYLNGHQFTVTGQFNLMLSYAISVLIFLNNKLDFRK
jgi:hypothetical protein